MEERVRKAYIAGVQDAFSRVMFFASNGRSAQEFGPDTICIVEYALECERAAYVNGYMDEWNLHLVV